MIRERWVGEKEKEKIKTGREEILTGKKMKREVLAKREKEREKGRQHREKRRKEKDLGEKEENKEKKTRHRKD